jgi:probable F420-dependent oxidoreductase
MTDRTLRPFRFGTGLGRAVGSDTLIDRALHVEKLGFSTVAVADHVSAPLAPLIALQAVADATTTLRTTMNMLDQDFRHPVMLAKELATLDVLSGGRVEVGIGAGWMKEDYEQTGIVFDRPAVRIERLEEVVIILKGLFACGTFSFEGKHFTITGVEGTPRPMQQPRPPIMIGGGARKVLSVAGRQADIVGLTAPNTGGSVWITADGYSADALAGKVGWIRDAAGDRFDDIELAIAPMGVVVSDDPQAGARAILETLERVVAPLGGAVDLTADGVLESPNFAVGSIEQICDKLISLRERYGVNYFSLGFGTAIDTVVPIIEALKGV